MFFLSHNMFNNLHVQLFSMHCARLLYRWHVNNSEIEVGLDSRQVLKCLLK